MEKGFRNEQNFASFIDRKMVKELPKEYQELLYSLFNNIEENSVVKCWQSKYYEKADVKIKVNQEIKGISIKSGKNCSMHQENTKKFYKFLTKIGVNNETINYFNEFMLGYVNGVRVSAANYINNNESKIKKIRNDLNKYYIKTNLIIRFLFQGTETQRYDCDALIYGTPSSFLWATKDEILKYLLDYKIYQYNHINISALNIKSYDRNLRNNINKIKKQEEIQVKWYSLEEDFKNLKKLRKTVLINKIK